MNKVHLKLTILCCSITAVLVLVIIMICLSVSEKGLTSQEESKFLNKANSIAADLQSLDKIDMNWYNRVTDYGKNILYIETEKSPIFLSSILYQSSADLGLIEDAKIKSKTESKMKVSDYDGSDSYYFKYKDEEKSCLVFSAKFTPINCIYIYDLSTYNRQITTQRIQFFFIWILSVVILFIFSYIFSGHTLKPIIKNQMKQKQFVTLASHELRSPLAVLKTSLSLQRKNVSAERSIKFQSIMQKEVNRMEHLVNDLLFLSKAEQAQLHYDFDFINIADLVNSVYEKYLPIANQKHINLEIDAMVTSHPPLIRCDRLRIEQVIIILLDNALTYTPEKGKIIISAYAVHAKYCIKVSDSGSGISDVEKEKIFDRFYQVNNSHTDKNHSGLGLSIAKEICIAHKGAIYVTDSEYGGSEFIVKIPAKMK